MASEVAFGGYQFLVSPSKNSEETPADEVVFATRKQRRKGHKRTHEEAIDPGPSADAATPAADLTTQTPFVTGFKHNTLHDMESLLWVSFWMVLCTRLRRPPHVDEVTWNACVREQSTLARTIFTDKQARFLLLTHSSDFHLAFQKLYPQVVKILWKLDAFRVDLWAYYQRCEENGVFNIGDNPAKGLHDKVEYIFDTISQMLQDADPDEDPVFDEAGKLIEMIGDFQIETDSPSEQQKAIKDVVDQQLDEQEEKMKLDSSEDTSDAVGQAGPVDEDNKRVSPSTKKRKTKHEPEEDELPSLGPDERMAQSCT